MRKTITSVLLMMALPVLLSGCSAQAASSDTGSQQNQSQSLCDKYAEHITKVKEFLSQDDGVVPNDVMKADLLAEGVTFDDQNYYAGYAKTFETCLAVDETDSLAFLECAYPLALKTRDWPVYRDRLVSLGCIF